MNKELQTSQLIPRREELERMFDKYPDVPREVAVKEDFLTQGLKFTEAALRTVESGGWKGYYLFSFDRTKISDMKHKEAFRVPEEFRAWGGPYQLRPIVFAIRINENSPYTVDVVDNQLKILFEGGRPVVDNVEFRPRPKYYEMSFEDGTPYYFIANLTAWRTITFCAPLRICQYWGDGEECKFCDINENVRQQQKAGRKFPAAKSVEQVVTVIEALVEEKRNTRVGEDFPLQKFTFSGGTVNKGLQGMTDEEFYLQYIKAVIGKIGSRWSIVLQTAAKDKEGYKRLRDAGVDCVLANIEVWDKRLFSIICPGKDRFVGRDEWIRRVIESVDVFGEGHVQPGFVSGCELAQPFGFKDIDSALKSMEEGIDYLMSHGVLPRMIDWCVEPLSALAGQSPPPLEYHVRLDKIWYDLWKKHGLPAPEGLTRMGPGRCVNPNSAYLDVGY